MLLLSTRSFTSGDVTIRRWVVRHPAFVVRILETRGVRLDDRLHPEDAPSVSRLVPDWPGVGIPLRGRGVIWDDRSEIELARGFLGIVDRGAQMRARGERTETFEAFVQWNPDVFGGPISVRPGSETPLARAAISARSVARLESVLHPVVASEPTHPLLAATLVELFSQLQAHGIVQESLSEGELAVGLPARLARVGRAIDGALSRPGARPKLVDVCDALGCSDRLARQLVQEYAEVYALEGATEWRSLVRGWTMYLAQLLTTARGATTDGVARLLGYGSSNALCHALANAGLPSPGAMRRTTNDELEAAKR